MRRFVTAVVLLIASMWAAPSDAHQTGASTFVVHVKPAEGVVDTLLTLPARDVAMGIELEPDLDEEFSDTKIEANFLKLGNYLDRHIQVTNDGKPCEVTEHKLSPATGGPGQMWFLKAFRCELPLGSLTLELDALVETPGSYRHLGKIQVGEEISTTVFDAAFGRHEIVFDRAEPEAPPEPQDTSFVRYLWEGVLHIVLGYDHVLFVLGLILIASDLRRLAGMVTVFTVAHSITLACAALDLVSISAAVIEPVIAFSVLWVGLDALRRVVRGSPEAEEHEGQGMARWYPYAATLLLGLMHGFGFSYVLRDEVGLPTDALLPALLAFNVGVELGQLAIVAAVYPVRAALRGRRFELYAVGSAAAAIAAAGGFWMLQRLFF